MFKIFYSTIFILCYLLETLIWSTDDHHPLDDQKEDERLLTSQKHWQFKTWNCIIFRSVGQIKFHGLHRCVPAAFAPARLNYRATARYIAVRACNATSYRCPSVFIHKSAYSSRCHVSSRMETRRREVRASDREREANMGKYGRNKDRGREWNVFC